MASTVKRVGKKVIDYPEDGVAIISTTSYVKDRLKDPKQAVSCSVQLFLLGRSHLVRLDNRLSQEPLPNPRVDYPIQYVQNQNGIKFHVIHAGSL